MMKHIVTAALIATGLAAPALACPNWQAAPSYGQITLSAGFLPDPYVLDVTAGGDYDLAGCFDGWTGSVASTPDYDLVWSGSSSQLTIGVDSEADTVLLINAPDGQWYYSGDASGLTFSNPQQGLYDIWVGANSGSNGMPGKLVITEQ